MPSRAGWIGAGGVLALGLACGSRTTTPAPASAPETVEIPEALRGAWYSPSALRGRWVTELPCEALPTLVEERDGKPLWITTNLAVEDAVDEIERIEERPDGFVVHRLLGISDPPISSASTLAFTGPDRRRLREGASLYLRAEEQDRLEVVLSRHPDDTCGPALAEFDAIRGWPDEISLEGRRWRQGRWEDSGESLSFELSFYKRVPSIEWTDAAGNRHAYFLDAAVADSDGSLLFGEHPVDGDSEDIYGIGIYRRGQVPAPLDPPLPPPDGGDAVAEAPLPSDPPARAWFVRLPGAPDWREVAWVGDIPLSGRPDAPDRGKGKRKAKSRASER